MRFLLIYLPKNLLSWLTGRLARVPIPRMFRKAVIGSFQRYYSIDTTAIEKPVLEYRTLAEFFSRALRPGARPLLSEFVSPVDGLINAKGTIERGTLVQAKGRNYSLSELLADVELAKVFEGGEYCSIYLAPPDYHRIHAPIDGLLQQITFVPGALWPVNEWAVENVAHLFSRNERVIFHFQTERGYLSLIAVGAFNVGSIFVPLCNRRTNQELFTSGRKAEKVQFDPPARFQCGDELARFEFGSTVIIVTERGMNVAPAVGTKVKYGEPF